MARAKSEIIIMRCTPALKVQVMQAAEARGVSLSEYISDTLKAELIREEMRRMNSTHVEHKDE